MALNHTLFLYEISESDNYEHYKNNQTILSTIYNPNIEQFLKQNNVNITVIWCRNDNRAAVLNAMQKLQLDRGKFPALKTSQSSRYGADDICKLYVNEYEKQVKSKSIQSPLVSSTTVQTKKPPNYDRVLVEDDIQSGKSKSHIMEMAEKIHSRHASSMSSSGKQKNQASSSVTSGGRKTANTLGITGRVTIGAERDTGMENYLADMFEDTYSSMND